MNTKLKCKRIVKNIQKLATELEASGDYVWLIDIPYTELYASGNRLKVSIRIGKGSQI